MQLDVTGTVGRDLDDVDPAGLARSFDRGDQVGGVFDQRVSDAGRTADRAELDETERKFRALLDALRWG